MPPTLTAKMRSALARSDVMPAMWNTRCDAAHRAAHRRAVEHVAVDELDVEAVELVEGRALAHEHAHGVARAPPAGA